MLEILSKLIPETVNISPEESSSVRKILLLRSALISKIREFFKTRQIIEVETPLLLPTTNPAPYLDSFKIAGWYLQTSPEFAMKRLLATGSKDIYQICKAFRRHEIGRIHNQEFTILEWYRLGFDHHQLMKEVVELLSNLANFKKVARYTYEDIYQEVLGINPHLASVNELQKLADQHKILLTTTLGSDKDEWLQLLFTHLIEPALDPQTPTLVYDFPASQAMLSRVIDHPPQPYQVASRFELYYQGTELANGFHELNDPHEQLIRFQNELDKRKALGLPAVPLDNELLSSLPNLPDCSGVAIGIDRLIMVSAKLSSLDEVLCFRQ